MSHVGYSKIRICSQSFCLSLFSVFIVLSVQVANAESQSNDSIPFVTVTTDKKLYKKGDMIVISGHIKSVIKNTPVTMQILDVNRNLVHVAQIDPSRDGNFLYYLKAEGPLWRGYGEYSVRIQYGFNHVGALTFFKIEGENEPSSKLFHVHDKTSGQVFEVNYTMTAGNLTDISIDPLNLSLILHIVPTNDGSIELKIPRQLLDAVTESGSDGDFLVFNNYRETAATTVSSDKYSRTIMIPFAEEDSEIEIIGTQVIPEFGSLAMVLFVLLMVFGLLISRINPLTWELKKSPG